MKRALPETTGSKVGSSFTRRMRIMTALSAAVNGKGYTAAKLSQLFGVSRRTLFRDLKEIRNAGIQPTYCRVSRTVPLRPKAQGAGQGGYVISSEQFLPPINLNLQEALGLLLLVHKMRGQLQLPFKHSALVAAMKIESGLPPRIRRYCESVLAGISAKAAAQAVSSTVPAKSSQDGFDDIFSLLQSSLAQRRKVRMRYDSLFDGGVIDCVLSPYHLFYNQRAWYVLGHSSMHNAVRTFKLTRIKNVVALDELFEDGDEFDLAEYIGRAWSMIPEGRIYNVRLHFATKVASNVAEVQWHSTQKAVRNADGSVIMDFRVDGLGEIAWWILGYGDQVKVLSPAILREKIVDIARKMIKTNNG